MTSEMSLNFTLKLGSARKEMKYVPLPGNPLGGFVYFNMNENGMSDFVDEGARLIAKNAGNPSQTVLFTAETSTLAIAHVLRRQYGYEVQVMTKRPRPDGKDSVFHEYCAITSTKSSVLYFDGSYTTNKKVVFFDNVCTTGETVNAARQVLYKLPDRLHIHRAIVLFTEGERRYSIKGIPLTSFGHLPIVDLTLAQAKKQFKLKSRTPLPTYKYGTIMMYAFENNTGKTVIVATNDLEKFNGHRVPIRVHDACMTSEVWMSQKCDCREQLEKSLEHIRDHGGAVIYMPNEGRGIGLANKFMVYEAQETKGLDTVDANRFLGFPDDIREYLAVKDILDHFGIRSIDLITNNPRKIEKLEELGVHIHGRVPCVVTTESAYCLGYMRAKAERMNHMISVRPPDILFYEPDEEYGFLSNFYPCEFEVGEKKYKSAEHFYQSQKLTNHPDIEKEIMDSATPADAFKLSRKYVKHVVDNWISIKVETMRSALDAKFSIPELREKLLATGKARLIENSPVDFFWGNAPNRWTHAPGENMLGKLLVEIRDN